MPKYLDDVRYWVNSGKHLLALSFSGFDPERTLALLNITVTRSLRSLNEYEQTDAALIEEKCILVDEI